MVFFDMIEKLNTAIVMADINLDSITGTTDTQVEKIIKLISHYGLYVMAAVIITTVVQMGIRSKRGGDVEIQPLIIEFLVVAALIAINAGGLGWIGL